MLPDTSISQVCFITPCQQLRSTHLQVKTMHTELKPCTPRKVLRQVASNPTKKSGHESTDAVPPLWLNWSEGARREECWFLQRIRNSKILTQTQTFRRPCHDQSTVNPQRTPSTDGLQAPPDAYRETTQAVRKTTRLLKHVVGVVGLPGSLKSLGMHRESEPSGG